MSDDIYDENAIAPSVYNTWGEGNADLGSLFEAARREEILRVLASPDAGGPFGAAIGARGPDPTLEGFLTNIDASDGISDVEKNYFDLLNNNFLHFQNYFSILSHPKKNNRLHKVI